MTAGLFCDVDDFCKFFPIWNVSLLPRTSIRIKRKYTVSPSEVMTILIMFHSSSSGNFKDFCLNFIPIAFGSEFSNRAGCNRFVELGHSVVVPLFACLDSRKSYSMGIAFVDSTPPGVCCNKRTDNHKTFAGAAERGKNSVGWFYGFKLPAVINDKGEIVSSATGKGNLDERKGLLEIIESTEGKFLVAKDIFINFLKICFWTKGYSLLQKQRKI